jgi:hypothetical protein
MVLHPGHPLVGRIVPVVRRYGQQEQGQWVLELPDGSRQYIPTSWCSPLSSLERTRSMPRPPQDGQPPEGTALSPLSVAALRALAGLVRRLQEEGAQRGEEQRHARSATRAGLPPPDASGTGAPAERLESTTQLAHVGELPSGAAAPGGVRDPASGPSARGDQGDESPPEIVRRP